MKKLDTKGLNIAKRFAISAAGDVNRAAKAGRLGPCGHRMQITHDAHSGLVWASEETPSTWTVDTATQVSIFCSCAITAQELIDRLAAEWELRK